MNAKTLLAITAVSLLAAGIFLQGDGRRVGSSAYPSPTGAARRILPASSAAVDWLDALGVDPGWIVALPIQADRYATTRLDPGKWSGTDRYQAFGSEVALGFQPDLVLVSPITGAGAVAKIKASGTRVLSVEEPPTWEGLRASGQTIARAVGMDDEAAEFLDALEARREALATREHGPLVVLPYSNYGGGGSTSGDETTIGLAIDLAGFVNAGEVAGFSGYADLAHEQILVLDFDAVLVMGGDLASSDSAARLIGAETLKDVPAIRDQRFIVVPEALYASGSHTILDAAEEIARQGDSLAGSPR